MAKEKREVGLIGQIKEAIGASGKSLYRLSKDSSVRPEQLYRFMAGERSLSLEAAEKVCQALDLELTAKKPKRGPAK